MISQVDPTPAIAGKNFTLECSVDISPYYDPEDIIFNWFFGPSNSSLPSNVIMSAVTYSSNIYTSTIEFSPLSLSHSGMYTCQLWHNESWSQTTMVSVKCKNNNYSYFCYNYSYFLYLGLVIGFEEVDYQVLEGNKLRICFNVEGNKTKQAVANVSILQTNRTGDSINTTISIFYAAVLIKIQNLMISLQSIWS